MINQELFCSNVTTKILLAIIDYQRAEELAGSARVHDPRRDTFLQKVLKAQMVDETVRTVQKRQSLRWLPSQILLYKFSNYCGIQSTHRVLAVMEIPDAHASDVLDDVFLAKDWDKADSDERD